MAKKTQDRVIPTAETVNPHGYYKHIGDTRKIAHPVMELWPTTIVLKSSEGGCFSEPYHNFEEVTDLSDHKLVKWNGGVEEHRFKKQIENSLHKI